MLCDVSPSDRSHDCPALVAGPLFWCRLVAVILLSCVFLVLVWVIVFVGSQRLLFGEIILPEPPQHNHPVWGLFNYFEINCPENVRNQAQSYLLRVLALTNAIAVVDGCYRLYA